MLGCFTLSHRSLRLSSFLLILFSFFLSASFISTILSFLPHLSYLLPPLFYCWFLPQCFLSHLLHYSFLIDFFISSRTLLNISCIFSILVSRLFVCNSILFSRFRIIFIIIILNYFSGRFSISSSLFGLVGIFHVPLPVGYFSPFHLV